MELLWYLPPLAAVREPRGLVLYIDFMGVNLAGMNARAIQATVMVTATIAHHLDLIFLLPSF